MIPFLIISFGKLIYREIEVNNKREKKEQAMEDARQSMVMIDDDFTKVEGEVKPSLKVEENSEGDLVEVEAEEEYDTRLEIGDDYYAVAFCATLNKAKQQCPNLTTYGFLRYFYNVMFVVTMQLTLLFLVSLELWYSPIYACHFYILVARFMCAVLLHMTIEPEVRQAILMYRYFVNHSSNFDREQEIAKEIEEKGFRPHKTQALIEAKILKDIHDKEPVYPFADDECDNEEEKHKTERYAERSECEWLEGEDLFCSVCEA